MATDEDVKPEDDVSTCADTASDSGSAAAEEKEREQESKSETKPVTTKLNSAAAPKAEHRPESFNMQPLMIAAVVAIACAVGQCDEIMGGRPMDLFKPHMVPPPKAASNEVVIQFCQS